MTARRARELRGEMVDVARAVGREWREDRVAGLAAEIAFFGLLSLFPGLLAVAAALGFIDGLFGNDLAARAEEEVLGFLSRVLTNRAEDTVSAFEDLFGDGSPGVLTLGTILALWAMSRGFVAVVNALDAAYDLEERRGYVRLRLTALLLSIGSVVVAAAMLGFVVVGPLFGTGRDVADAVGLGGVFEAFWDWLRWPAVLVLLVAWAATVFHVAPNHRTPWRWDVPGALLASALWVAFSLGFRLYLSLASGANQVFGVLGGALIVLMWLYLMGIGLLLGGELNAVLAKRHAVVQPPREPRHRVRHLLDGARRLRSRPGA